MSVSESSPPSITSTFYISNRYVKFNVNIKIAIFKMNDPEFSLTKYLVTLKPALWDCVAARNVTPFFSPPLLCFSSSSPHLTSHLSSPCWAPFFSFFLSALLPFSISPPDFHFPLRWNIHPRHPAVIMNSLVATPPVPPHFYENPRLSPSRISMTPSAGSLLNTYSLESMKNGIADSKLQCLHPHPTPAAESGKLRMMATTTTDACLPPLPTRPPLHLANSHPFETSSVPDRTSPADLFPSLAS